MIYRFLSSHSLRPSLFLSANFHHQNYIIIIRINISTYVDVKRGKERLHLKYCAPVKMRFIILGSIVVISGGKNKLKGLRIKTPTQKKKKKLSEKRVFT